MKAKTTLFLTCLLFLVLITRSFSQNAPELGAKENDTIIVNTGMNYILLPGIDDNDTGDQSISFTYNSSDNSIVSIESVDHEPGQRFAVMHVKEHGKTGNVTIDVEIDDGDGTDSKAFDVIVSNYSKTGVYYEVHDMIFWQQVNPFGKTPLYDTIIEKPDVIADEINWENIPLTVSGDCDAEWCDGHDFATAMIKGYVVPPETGEYTFYQIHQDADALFLSTDASYDNVRQIGLDSGGEGNDEIGESTDMENEWKSIPVNLEVNQVYAFYAVQWNIHFENVILEWEGPGIDKQVISSENLYYVYDTIPPEKPENLEVSAKGDTEIDIIWEPSSDNQKLAGYNLFINGIQENDTPITGSKYTISGLEPETRYSIAISATDDMGNVSALSNIVTLTTYPKDNNPPDAPAHLVIDEATGVAVKITWDEAIDNETEVIGYDIYVDGEKYNTDHMSATSVILGGLTPETTYRIEVRSIDAGNNESDPGAVLEVQTTTFEAGDNLGVKNGSLSFNLEAISRNEGIGINMPHPYKEQMPDDLMKQHFRDLNVGALRLTWDWDLEADCDRWAATDHFMGPDIEYSIGDFMDLCNQYNAYTTLTVTLQEDGWFVNDPQSFANIIEYFAGPESSTWGSERAAEGYTESLLESSPGLVIQYGNEVWGGNAHCIPLGEDLKKYAQWCRDMDTIIKTSPYYDPEKIFTCYSGRNPRPEFSWGQNKSLYEGDDREVDWMALSGYMGGNFDYDPGVDPGETELEFMKNGIETMLDKIRGLRDQNRDMLIMTGEIKPIWFYEGNFTNSSYFGRFGQAIVFSDYLATGMETGLAIPILYSLYSGQWKIIAPSLDHKRFPLFHMAALFNAHCKGDILKTEFSSQNTIKNTNGEVLNADPVSCHAYHRDGKYSILLISRDFENDYYVEVNVPENLNFNSSGKKYVVTTDHFSSYETHIDSTAMTIANNMMVKVPKFGMVLMTFSGDDQDFTELPLGYWGDYVKADNITIECEENTHTITEAGKLHFSAIITPEDAFATSPKWQILDDDLGVVFYQGTLSVSNAVTGTDTLYIKASAGEVSDTYMVVIDIASGINDALNHKIRIFPNPARDMLTISTDSKFPAVLTITNIHGKYLLSREITDVKTQIDASGFNPGLYLLRIQAENGDVYNKKFIINP
jgi:hypothetical protein